MTTPTIIAYQLYCSRKSPSIAATCRMLADAGYENVEGYGGLFADMPALQAALADNGLAMPSCHIGVDLMMDDAARAVEICKTLGITKAFGPHLMPDARPTDAAGWSAFGKAFAEKARPLVDAGITIGWHNHDFEFADLGSADHPLDLILAASDDIHSELDLGWVVRAGLDPVATIQKYSGRIAAAHVKDIAPAGENADEDGWADVGHGTLDWSAIAGALSAAGVTHFVAEHDNPSDDARFAARSLATIKTF